MRSHVKPEGKTTLSVLVTLKSAPAMAALQIPEQTRHPSIS